MNYVAALIGRIFIALLFLYSGTMKLIDPSAAAGMLTGLGLPGSLAMVAGVFEVIAERLRPRRLASVPVSPDLPRLARALGARR